MLVFTRDDGNLPHFEKRTDEIFDKIELTDDVVLRAIKSFPGKISSGPDGIPSFLLKKLASSVLEPLKFILDKSLQSGNLPKQWLVAKVVPIYKKKGSNSDPINYRPVSLTSVACKILTALIQHIWNREKLPTDWSTSVIIPLFKKGDKAVCGNHRGIALLDTAYKLLEIIILNRIRPESETIARENQCGFRPNRSTIDQIVALRLLIEQRQEYRRPLVIAFVDFKAAFDSVDRERMMEILGEAGLPFKIIKMIRALYHNCSSRVRVYGEETKQFPVNTGVKQGGVTSPEFFKFVVDAVLRKSMVGDMGIRLSEESEPVTDFDFADDIALVAEDSATMQTMIDKLKVAAAEVGLSISAPKTKITHRNCPPPAILLDGSPLEIVDDFPYLGTRLDLSGDCSKEI